MYMNTAIPLKYFLQNSQACRSKLRNQPSNESPLSVPAGMERGLGGIGGGNKPGCVPAK